MFKKILIYIFASVFLFFGVTKTIFATNIVLEWKESKSLPYKLSNHISIAMNNNLYVIDGSAVTGQSHDEIIRAAISETGDLTNWETISHLPKKLIWHSSVNDSNHIFVLGGYIDSIEGISESVNSVYMSEVNNDASLSEWRELNTLPQTLSIGAGVIHNNTIYYAGGVTDAHQMYQTAQSKIYKTEINSDGTIGNWSEAGDLQYPNFGMKIVNIGNYLFEIGGYGTNSAWHVRRALISTNGMIGNWEEQPPVPYGIAMFGLAKIDNSLLIIGGDIGGQTNKVFHSTINSDSSLSTWSELSEGSFLPKNLGNNSVSVWGNKIYSIGGQNSVDGYFNDVYMTEFSISPPSGSPLSTPTASPFTSPTPTPSPSPSVTAQPTNTPKPINKIFFAPGLGGSWNLDAIINCKTNNYVGEWTLAPFAKQIYQPFIDGVNQTNWKLNSFYYDWRLDVRSNSQKLKNYINSKTDSYEKVNFVGHSMGGIVGRSYLETNSGGKISSYISVGSPHNGAVDAYSVANEEIWNDNLVQKIAETIVINRCGVPPSIKNLLPTFDYLKDAKTGNIKPVSKMKLQNNYLSDSFSPPYWGVKMGTLSGDNNKTLNFLRVKNNLRWSDGKPIEKEFTRKGDGTVLLSSSQLSGAQNIVINQTHAGLIGSTEGTNKILDFFGTQPIEDPIYTEAESALVIVGYPGNFWVKDKDGKIIQSDQGVVSIINPETQELDVKIIPQKANTLFIIAQFLPNGETKYKEYRYWGFGPISKKIHFNSERPREDICGDR